MGKFEKFLFLVLLLLIFPKLTFAQGVDLSLSTNQLTTQIGVVSAVELYIKNTQEKTDSFKINVIPPSYSGIGTLLDKSLITIDAGATEKVRLTFFVSECIETVGVSFDVIVQSITNENVKDSETLIVRAKGEGMTCITQLVSDKAIYKAGEKVKVGVVVKNFARAGEFTLETSLKREGAILGSFTDTFNLSEGGEKNFNYEYAFPAQAISGYYSIESILKKDNKIISSKILRITLKGEPKLEVQGIYKNYFFFQKALIKISNEGNDMLESFDEKIVLPSFMDWFFYSPLPVSKSRVNGNIQYSWKVPALAPGESYEIVYETRLWSIWILSGSILVAIFLGMRYVYSLTLIKEYRPKSSLAAGKDISVFLEIRNKTGREMKNLIVKDYVPPVVTLVEKFPTLRPQIKKAGDRIELTWKIPILKAGEEVVLSYKIRPIVEIMGTLKLPPATLKFVDMGRIRKVTAAKKVE